MIPTILTKQPMVPCQLTLHPTRQYSRCTSMVTSVYTYKFGIITNGLGIVRDITFYNKDFLKAHPDIVVEKKTNSPDEDKSLADSKALLPVLINFFQKHPLIEPKTFLGGAAFDTIEIYKSLFKDIGFRKAFIPLRVKLSMEGTDYTVNENGIPCCPHDPTLPMKREGSKSHLKSKIHTMKFVCPKMKWDYNPADKSKHRVCHCDNPCTTSSCGQMALLPVIAIVFSLSLTAI